MELIMIRGLPGSGKTTMAKAMTEYEHYEADMFFLDSKGVYTYDRSKIREAHEWCQCKVFDALSGGKRVVVSNTFTRLVEMEPYLEICKSLGIELHIVEATGCYANVHGVPDEVVQSMRKRWETV